MSDQVKRALSDAEWAKWRETQTLERHGSGAGIEAVEVSDGALFLWNSRYQELHVPLSELPALIALANAARAEDDPGRLRREDVAALRHAEHIIRKVEGYSVASALESLAAKLNALLPPEADPQG